MIYQYCRFLADCTIIAAAILCLGAEMVLMHMYTFFCSVTIGYSLSLQLLALVVWKVETAIDEKLERARLEGD